jgi:type IV secretory pathway VirB3-like protein
MLKKIQFLTFLTIFRVCFFCLLKIVEIVIIHLSGEKMKQQVLKALANPARIFYVPYNLAIINFAVQFIVFIILFVIDLILNKTDGKITPLYFLISVIIVHSILAVFSKRDPQLGQIVAAKIQLLKQKIPGKLVA